MNFKIPVYILIVTMSCMILPGCKFRIQDAYIQQSLKPDQLLDYTPQGGLVFGTVMTPHNDGNIIGIDFMLENSSDFTLPIKQAGGVDHFMVDVPTQSEGISRIGVRNNYQGFEESTWFIDFYQYSIPVHTNYSAVVTNKDINIITTIRDNKMVSVTNIGGTVTNHVKVVNYIGRFIVSINNKFALPKDNFILGHTNDIERDREILYKNYPDLTNAEIYFIELRKKK